MVILLMLALCTGTLLVRSQTPSPTLSPTATPQDTAKPAATSTPVATPEKDGVATFVGSEQCKECHEDISNSFGRTVHSKVKGWEKQAVMDCESCHGPASVHLKKVEEKDAVGIGLDRLASLPAPEVSQVCMKCHEAQHGQAEWRFSRHASGSVSCISCHSMHPEKKKAFKSMLKDKDPDMCYTCHREQQAQVHWPSRHPIREGRILCGDCHNPHGNKLTAYKNAPNARELCLSCHAQYRGPFAQGHAPSSDSCLDCHRAHGSVENKLLVASEPFLCLRCHSTIHNPHRAAGSLSQTQFQSQTMFFSRCTTCHNQVHGSNLGPSLTR